MITDYKSDATEQEAIDALSRSIVIFICLATLLRWKPPKPCPIKGFNQSVNRSLCFGCRVETRKVHGDGPLSRYSADLEIPREQKIEVDFLKAIAGHYLINAAHSQDRYAKQHVIIKELVEMLLKYPHEMDSFFQKPWNEAGDEDRQNARDYRSSCRAHRPWRIRSSCALISESVR